MSKEKSFGKFDAIGLMSGTSLDGLDVAHCTFEHSCGKWSFLINHAKTYLYDDYWKQRLATAPSLSALELAVLNVEFGKHISEFVLDFIRQINRPADLIASHGHTVFHQPAAGLTLQIGSGAEIAANTGITTVCDFRSQDVALGGQGAPLAPLGDELLFGEYDFCLNLGGFSNISFNDNGRRLASDICPVNTILNKLARTSGSEYDKDGNLAASGRINDDLLNRLNNLDFYKQPWPKSLGREWLEDEFLPVITAFDIDVKDQLRTVCEHVAIQIARQTESFHGKSMLITGGGAKNRFLIERIRNCSTQKIIIPDEMIIDFKEAIIFALSGTLRMINEVNCFSTATGAAYDHISGAVYAGSNQLSKPNNFK